MATALEQKIAQLKELGIDSPEGILSLITSGGIDTPAKRQALKGVMDNPALNTTDRSKLGIGDRGLNTPADEYSSVIQDKVKYVSEVLKSMGVQEGSPQYRQMMHKMLSNSGFDAGRDKVNMFAPQEEYSEQVMNMLVNRAIDAGLQPGTPAFRDFIMHGASGGSTDKYIETLDIGSRGLNTAAEQDFVADSFVGRGQNKLLENWQDKATAQASDTNQQMFENKLNQLDSAQLDQVMKVMSPMTTEQKERFVNDVINGQVSLTGYGIQDEAQPGELTPNFAGQGIQYNTGTTLPNLGFAGY